MILAVLSPTVSSRRQTNNEEAAAAAAAQQQQQSAGMYAGYGGYGGAQPYPGAGGYPAGPYPGAAAPPGAQAGALAKKSPLLSSLMSEGHQQHQQQQVSPAGRTDSCRRRQRQALGCHVQGGEND